MSRPWRPVNELPVSHRVRAVARHGADDSSSFWRTQRPSYGRKFFADMKTLVIGLDSAVPELLFSDERLTNFRRLMEAGSYGELETIIPPITVPAWMCMATSQDPGSLGVYGFRNRTDHSYNGL